MGAESKDKERLKEETKKLRKLEGDLRALFTEINVEESSSWTEVMAKIQGKEAFAAVTEAQAEKMFKDYQKDLGETCLHNHGKRKTRRRRRKPRPARATATPRLRRGRAGREARRRRRAASPTLTRTTTRRRRKRRRRRERKVSQRAAHQCQARRRTPTDLVEVETLHHHREENIELRLTSRSRRGS